jgi:hypothetical protein
MQANNIYQRLVWVPFLALMLGGCGPSQLPPVEYARWISDYAHGIHKKKEIKPYVFDVQLKPHDFIILNEFRGQINDSASYMKRKRELGGMQYFDLKISSAGGDLIKSGASSEAEYQQRLYYFSFDFQKDISLMDGDKMLPCGLFHFERSYSLSATRNFVLGFQGGGSEENDKTLVIDSEVLGLGTVKIKFDKDDLSEIPQLKIAL